MFLLLVVSSLSLLFWGFVFRLCTGGGQDTNVSSDDVIENRVTIVISSAKKEEKPQLEELVNYGP
jgi:hypothetical protein